jgi:hypothetical protein
MTPDLLAGRVSVAAEERCGEGEVEPSAAGDPVDGANELLVPLLVDDVLGDGRVLPCRERRGATCTRIVDVEAGEELLDVWRLVDGDGVSRADRPMRVRSSPCVAPFP